MGSELHVSERVMFNAKITSTRIAWLDDSTKISTNYRRFTVYHGVPYTCILKM